MFNDRSDPLTLLQTRRSGKPRDLGDPGPDAAQLRTMLEVAMRTPDHGKLAPWRFVIVEVGQRDALGALLERAYRAETPNPGRLEIEAMHQFAHQAPVLVVILSSPKMESKIPLWEQELSAGAAAMNLLHAAHAQGFAGGWLTGWPSYSPTVARAFGTSGEKIAGFVFIGTPQRELGERPRPEYDSVVSTWDI
jgi:nitroreductase